MDTNPTVVERWYYFPVMEKDESKPLINVCSEYSTQKKRLSTAVNNMVLFTVMDPDPTSMERWYYFPVMETD